MSACTRICRSACGSSAASERIIREEMDAAGAEEVRLPVIQPIELWEKSGRKQAMAMCSSSSSIVASAA